MPGITRGLQRNFCAEEPKMSCCSLYCCSSTAAIDDDGCQKWESHGNHWSMHTVERAGVHTEGLEVGLSGGRVEGDARHPSSLNSRQFVAGFLQERRRNLTASSRLSPSFRPRPTDPL